MSKKNKHQKNLMKTYYQHNSTVKFSTRLYDAVDRCRKYKSPMLRTYTSMLSLYANRWYDGKDMNSYLGNFGFSGGAALPLNLIDRGVQTLGPFLVSNDPRCKVAPRKGISNRATKPFANTLELALVHLFYEIALAELTLRPVAIDSLFFMGITKTGTNKGGQVEIDGYLHDYGQPFCDKVDVNDYIFDGAARNREEMQWEGDEYRIPLREVMESDDYNKKNAQLLKPDLRLYGDNTYPESVAKEAMPLHGEHELYPTVALMDIWLPKEGIIQTYPANRDHGTRPLREVEYDGPESGPYDTLDYKHFPNSIIPIPPVYTWLDLNRIVNVMMMKMVDMVEREKTVAAYNLGDQEDANVFKHAGHGEGVGVENVDALKEITFGGFNPQSFPFLQFVLTQWSQAGPNMEIMGGKGVMANTLGQEQMLQNNALREVDDMVAQLYKFTQKISRKLAWYLWSDPLIMIPVIKRVAGREIETVYSEATKEGDFFDYNFEIEPFSMARMNPDMRYQRLLQLVSQLVLPLLPMAMTQGNVLDVNALLKEAAPYLNINNIEEWWKSIVPQNAQMGPYQPLQGTVAPNKIGDRPKGGQGNDQFGSTTASRMSNNAQQQAR